MPATYIFLSSTARDTLPIYDLLKTIVSIKVGPDLKQFHLHKELLCHHSGFFRAALEGTSSDAANGEITLPEENVESFKLFIGWIYQDSIPLTYDVFVLVQFNVDEPQGHENELAKSSMNRFLQDMIGLYGLADTIDIVQLRNEVLMQLSKGLTAYFQEWSRYYMSTDILQQLSNSIRENSQLMEFMLDCLSVIGFYCAYEECALPESFYVTLLTRRDNIMIDKQIEGKPWSQQEIYRYLERE